VKIAFVGKGGSGKSTLTALFIRYLQKMERRTNILAIDADLNMSLAGLLGAQVPSGAFISSPTAAEAIRTHLKGTNPRIENAEKFLPTTPPGRGSNLIESADEPALAPYAVRISDNPLVNLLTVGTYEADGIGQSCYHVNLFVAENILSHSMTSDKFHVVTDMVAGTDAFAYSLHLQFDAINLIVEPTPESIEVCQLYLGLARESGVESLVHLIANKVEDANDLDFITTSLGKKPIAVVPVLPALKRGRQLGQIITQEFVDGRVLDAMRSVEQHATEPAISRSKRLTMLHALHKKLNAKKWVELGYGNLEGQIDPEFKLYEENLAGVV
jgi:CO dehydrogenase maturation factor